MTKIYENKINIQTFEKNKLYKKESPRKKSISSRHSNQSLSPNQKIKEKYLFGKGGKKFRFNYNYFKYQYKFNNINLDMIQLYQD